MALASFGLYLAATVLLSINGCETPEKRYRVMSFFFDGVPNPYAPKVAAKPGEDEDNPAARGKITRVIVHKPYDEGRCDACHGAAKEFSEFTKMGSDVCLQCHRKELNKFPIMHGPVSAGECLLCHVPHESQYPHLMKEPAPDLCIRCHLPELLPEKPEEHQTLAVSCLDCHFGHGGTKHGLLRPVATSGPTTRSTTAPSSQPTTNLFTASANREARK